MQDKYLFIKNKSERERMGTEEKAYNYPMSMLTRINDNIV